MLTLPLESDSLTPALDSDWYSPSVWVANEMKPDSPPSTVLMKVSQPLFRSLTFSCCCRAANVTALTEASSAPPVPVMFL
jgi:hypothetical protein